MAETPKTKTPPKGEDAQDPTKTPGDGTLQGAVPAGLTVEELRRRAEKGPAQGVGGTG